LDEEIIPTGIRFPNFKCSQNKLVKPEIVLWRSNIYYDYLFFVR